VLAFWLVGTAPIDLSGVRQLTDIVVKPSLLCRAQKRREEESTVHRMLAAIPVLYRLCTSSPST
jgi:hypothetical protein